MADVQVVVEKRGRDKDDVERIDVRALGGADTLTVNDAAIQHAVTTYNASSGIACPTGQVMSGVNPTSGNAAWMTTTRAQAASRSPLSGSRHGARCCIRDRTTVGRDNC